MGKKINELETELQNCRAQIEKLKSENNELAGNLHLVNEKLRDSERLKGHFISNITNEIINPFASVLALSSSIQRISGDEISKAHRMAELIFDEAFHLDFQLKNIFAAAIIEAGNDELKISGFILKDILQQILQYFSKQLQDKKLAIKVDFENCPDKKGDFVFTSDCEKFEMILKNLINNSIKFNPEDSAIELVFCYSNNTLSIEISDHGKGIQPEDRKAIFDRFKQLDERINSINTGHGLGLSIVKAYTDLLGGDLRFADNYKGGTRVVVSLPESNNQDDWDDLEGFLLDTETSY